MFNTSLNNGGSEKVGTIKAFGGSVAPFGWLICDGSAISRTLYAALFDVIGETYGAGDGSTTFNLPNGKMPLGNSARCAGNNIALGFTVGSSTNYGLATETSHKIVAYSKAYGAAIPTSGLTGGIYPDDDKAVGITTDSTNSGIIADLTTASAASTAIIKY